MTKTAASPEDPGEHYSRTAVVLHWLIALLVIGSIPLGLYGARVQGDAGQAATNAHKAIGMTILALSLARIAWRIIHPAPALPQTMPQALRLAARATHASFYILLLALPASGWWMSSAVPERHPFGWFGLFEFPFLPIRQSMASAGPAHEVHVTLGWVMGALVILHVAAALKHHWIDRDGILTRMLPRRRLHTAGDLAVGLDDNAP